jgi:hypothetical protein
MKLSPRTAQVNLRMSPDLKAAAEKAAEAAHRSLASLIEVLLIEHIGSSVEAAKKQAGKKR